MPPYTGKLLRVNLTTGQTAVEEIPAAYYQLFMGGRGLGAALLYDEVAADADPLNGEQNRLIFSTGPLTGLGASGSAKCVVTCKSPLTGTYLYSITSKSFGVRLKRAGYDALVIQGVAPRPALLVIRDGQIEVRDAAPLWGLPVDTAEQQILATLGRKEFSVALIGPAGENQVRLAAIINDEGRAFGRGGAGAVMGAMGLKAIAVAGRGRISAAAPGEWKEALNRQIAFVKGNPKLKIKTTHGTIATLDTVHDLGLLPVLNFRSTVCDWVQQIGSGALPNYKVKSTTCAPCVVGCTQWTQGTTPDGVTHVAEGPEYETLYALGTTLGIREMPYIIQADRLCDQLGLDTMSAGLTLGFAMECWEKGLLTAADTGGLDLSWGNGPATIQALADMAHRRGFGNLLAEGSARLAAHVGQGSAAWAMQVKGMELGGYDPRAAKGMALVYAAGPRGGCHHAGGYTVFGEYGPGKNPYVEEGKAALTRTCRAEQIAYDCAVVCTFNLLLPVLPDLLSAGLGRTVTAGDLIDLGDRISHLERLFNMRAGVRRRHDSLPLRLTTEPIPDGPAAGQVVHLDAMLTEFYQVCGWDPQTGIPLAESLHSHGMDRWAPDAQLLRS